MKIKLLLILSLFLSSCCVKVDSYNKNELNKYLVRMIRSHEIKYKTNTFYLYDDSSEYLNVYWEEGHCILFPEKPLDSIDPDNDFYFDYWEYTKKGINLKTDVVPTPEDVMGSSFLVDKPFVDDLIKKCKESGDKIIM